MPWKYIIIPSFEFVLRKMNFNIIFFLGFILFYIEH